MAAMSPASSTRSVRVPGDKSISHRALICAAMANGRSRVKHILPSADVHSTASVLRALGAGIPELTEDIRIDGRGLGGLQPATVDLDCGNSGTTARLMCGVLSAHRFESRLTGDASLSRRPMARVARPLTAMGATFAFDEGEHLPMVVHGAALQSIAWESPTASAQVKSAILFAGVVAGVGVTVMEPVKSRDHTERMLCALGVEVNSCGGRASLVPATELSAFQIDVPADPSSAAFLAALAAAGGIPGGAALALTDVALNPTRLGFFRVLREMGADVTWEVEREECGEPVGTITVAPRTLTGVQIRPEQVPSMIDELPLLACLATRAHGETEVRGASELRVKESDRITAVVQNLRAVGADAEELSDGLRVRGSGEALGGPVIAHGDHRLAMAFGVLGAVSGRAIDVDDRHCVSVSYPGFWDDLARVTA
ncbi:MAG TPA: 3-phosphoshikimate 1-carboxyvinyltransferase [Gemmatimonadaceae bacterium]|nr:3-phosphoshikimate 1-carboxyvinyltransferase [Gemmatimonadaceae bacterium]